MIIYQPMPEGKVCRVCQAWKPRSELVKHTTSTLGVEALCAMCNRAKARTYQVANAENVQQYQQQYRTENAEQLREKKQQYRTENADKIQESNRRYRTANLDKMREKDRLYRINHPDKIREYGRRYYAADPQKLRRNSHRWESRNPAKMLAKTHRRRARRQQIPGNFTAHDWQHCLDYWNGHCAYCGEAPRRLTADHFVPISVPGCPGTVPQNMLPACRSCNSSKCNRNAPEWLSWKFGPDQAREILARIEIYFARIADRS